MSYSSPQDKPGYQPSKSTNPTKKGGRSDGRIDSLKQDPNSDDRAESYYTGKSKNPVSKSGTAVEGQKLRGYVRNDKAKSLSVENANERPGGGGSTINEI